MELTFSYTGKFTRNEKRFWELKKLYRSFEEWGGYERRKLEAGKKSGW